MQGKLHQSLSERQCLARIWEHTTDIPFPRSPHSVSGCSGVLSQARTGLFKLHSVSLLWTSLNTEAWTFPSGFPKAGQERTEEPITHSCLHALLKWRAGLAHTEGSERIMSSLFLYNHRNLWETQDHTSPGQDLISQGFIWMLLPESQTSYLHYPLSTSPQKAAETQDHTVMAMATVPCHWNVT